MSTGFECGPAIGSQSRPQQLGGTTAIKSTVGEGTTVTIWLPRAQTVPAIREPSQAADQLPSAPSRILLVDDDGAVRALTEDMLTSLGHKVVAVESGSAAITRLSADPTFDLLLVDFAMPMMNGAEVAAKAVRLRPHLPVLFTTGYADTGVLQSWMQGYHTLNKPFSAADLELAVRQTIRARSNIVPMARIRPT